MGKEAIATDAIFAFGISDCFVLYRFIGCCVVVWVYEPWFVYFTSTAVRCYHFPTLVRPYLALRAQACLIVAFANATHFRTTKADRSDYVAHARCLDSGTKRPTFRVFGDSEQCPRVGSLCRVTATSTPSLVCRSQYVISLLHTYCLHPLETQILQNITAKMVKQPQRDPGAPKRNMSAYLLYQNAMRESFKALNPGE